MTPQEQQLIDGLVDRIRNTPATDKDDDADRYLHQQLDTAPDALYVLAQTVLVQQYGLENAQRQIADLRQQLEQAQAQPKKSGSFLSHLLGTDQPQPPAQQQPYQPVNQGYTPPPPPPPGYAPVNYGQPAGYGQPVGYAPSGGGFLRGALQTAAGVAAGEMVFQGVEGLFHGFGGGPSYGRPTEVIENNYYSDDRGEHEHHAADDSSFYNPDNDASRQGLSPDIEDRRGFADTSDDNTNNDDDNNSQGFDDGGGFDSSDSGYDDGGGDFGSGGDDNSF